MHTRGIPRRWASRTTVRTLEIPLKRGAYVCHGSAALHSLSVGLGSNFARVCHHRTSLDAQRWQVELRKLGVPGGAWCWNGGGAVGVDGRRRAGQVSMICQVDLSIF